MASSDTHSLAGWLVRGWSAFRRDPLPLMGGSAVMQAFGFGETVVELAVSPAAGLVLLLLTGPILSVGWAALCLRHVRGRETLVTDVFSAFARFGAAWATFMLYSLIVLAGFFLFIIPGFYWSAKFGLCYFFVMDPGAPGRGGQRQDSTAAAGPSAFEAVQASGRLTEGHAGKIFCLIAIMIGGLAASLPFQIGLGLSPVSKGTNAALLLIGLVPFLLNVLVVIPWVWASLAAAYEGLSGRPQP